MIEVVGSSKIIVHRYQYTRHHTPEDRNHSVSGLLPGEIPAGTLVQNTRV